MRVKASLCEVVADQSARRRLRRAAKRFYTSSQVRLERAAIRHRYDAPTETQEWFDGEALGVSKDTWSGDRRYYAASPWRVLRQILDPDEVSSDDVFIDFGCGTGRVLLEAADRYPFKRVIGIDFVPKLVEIARDLIARNRDRFGPTEVEIIEADALEYDVPDDVTVVYMYDPFRGQIFEAVAEKLIASVDRNPRRLRLIYFFRSQAEALKQSGRIRFVRYGRRAIRRWQEATYLAMYEITPET